MATVKDLREFLATQPDDLEVVIYPKYSSGKVDGFKKHSFRIDQVCFQTPTAASFKNDEEKMKEYFKGNKPKQYEINNHVAILF